MENEWVSGKAQLSIEGSPFEVSFTVPAKPLKLSRMLPVFQRMSDNFNQLGMASLESRGESIACKAGCGACCRQLVPISEAEAFDLRRVVEAMPEERRAEITQRFAAGLEQLNKVDFFARLQYVAETDTEAYSAMLGEYFTNQIACPFLEHESCSIHPSRPVACREYLVTSPAENCSSAAGEGVENIGYLLKVKDTLISVGRNEMGTALPFLPMIRMMEWTAEREDSSIEKTGAEWMQLFFSKLIEISRMADS